MKRANRLPFNFIHIECALIHLKSFSCEKESKPFYYSKHTMCAIETKTFLGLQNTTFISLFFRSIQSSNCTKTLQSSIDRTHSFTVKERLFTLSWNTAAAFSSMVSNPCIQLQPSLYRKTM